MEEEQPELFQRLSFTHHLNVLFCLSDVEECQAGTLLCNLCISFIKSGVVVGGGSVPELLHADGKEAVQATDDNPSKVVGILVSLLICWLCMSHNKPVKCYNCDALSSFLHCEVCHLHELDVSSLT